MRKININKILFPCDLTKSADIVAPYVISLAEQYQSATVFLHVIPDIHDWKAILTPVPSLTMYFEKIHDHAEKQLDAFIRENFPSHLDDERLLKAGDPVDIILDTINREKIDLVVMGTHGAKGLEHRIFGGVANNVVKKSPVPVLVVNPHRISS